MPEKRFQRLCGRSSKLEAVEMHTGTLIDELMEIVEQAMSGPSIEKEEKRFFVWDAVPYERQVEVQPNLAGVA